MTQEVFVELFRADGKLLRSWDPERGMGLKSFVGFVAEQRVAAIMRSQRRNPWTEDPTLDATFGVDEGDDAQSPEELALSRETIAKVLEGARAALSPKGQLLFRLLIVEQRSTKEVCDEVGMRVDAVHAWRSRLKKLLLELLAELQGEEAS